MFQLWPQPQSWVTPLTSSVQVVLPSMVCVAVVAVQFSFLSILSFLSRVTVQSALFENCQSQCYACDVRFIKRLFLPSLLISILELLMPFGSWARLSFLSQALHEHAFCLCFLKMSTPSSRVIPLHTALLHFLPYFMSHVSCFQNVGNLSSSWHSLSVYSCDTMYRQHPTAS